MPKRTKIVCTIGPSSWQQETIRKMAVAGMDVVRINMAHGSYKEQAQTIKKIRAVARELNKPIAIEVDLQGPKIRVGEIAGDGLKLISGKKVVFSTNPKLKNTPVADLARDKIFIQYPNLHRDVEVGARLLLVDGAMSVKVTAVDGHDIVCQVLTGGILKSHKGLNFPDTSLSVPTITDKDIADLKFALAEDVEWVGLSFVRVAKDITDLRELIDRYSKGKQPATLITAKIETHEAMDNLTEIIEVADGIVIARGDLGPEISIHAVPEFQKIIIKESREQIKPVIVATQMLFSMVNNPRPTRAEVSDVANTVFDNVDAIYLSDETASGQFPVVAVSTAASIIKDAESSPYDDVSPFGKMALPDNKKDLAVLSRHAASVAREVKAKVIVVTTVTGQTAVAVSSARQEIPIVAVTGHKKVQRQLSLVWGVYPIVSANIVSVNSVTKDIKEFLKKEYRLQAGDKVVFVDGVKKNKTEGEKLVGIFTI
jgi:pyruvate kinase